MSDHPFCSRCGADRSDTVCYRWDEHASLRGAKFADLCCECFESLAEIVDAQEPPDEG